MEHSQVLSMMIHCTKKLGAFIGVQNSAQAGTENEEKWNAHLVPIGGRKCLFFTHKETLYSVLIPDLLKKDLKRVNELFFEAFLTHLRSDGINHFQRPDDLKAHFGSLMFLPTDNDQKTLGTLRDHIDCMKFSIGDKQDKLAAADDFAKTSMNWTPLGAKKYQSAKQLMKEKLNQLA